MEGVLGEDRRKSLRVLNWAIRLTQTIRSQPRGSCLASSPLLGTNGRLARWGNSRPPISPPRARPVIQGAVENGCALAFSAGALVNFPAPSEPSHFVPSCRGAAAALQPGEWRRRAPDQGRGEAGRPSSSFILHPLTRSIVSSAKCHGPQRLYCLAGVVGLEVRRETGKE
jgi:hypothetical protein